MSALLRNVLFGGAVVCSSAETAAVGFGGHIHTWEFLVWVWCVPVGAFSWWLTSRRADS